VIGTWVAAACVGLACAALMRPSADHRLRAYLPPLRSETVPSRRRARALHRARERQTPGALGVMIALLDAGIPLADSVAAAALATEEPLGACLRDVSASLRLGADEQRAWTPLEDSPSWQEVIAAVRRSGRTGSSLSAVLAQSAQSMRTRQRADATIAARKLGVRAILPLATCSLPAFFLLGILPVIVSLALPLLSDLA